MVAAGVTRVRVRYVGRAPDPPGLKTPQTLQRPDERLYKASLPRGPSQAVKTAANLAKASGNAAGKIPLPPSPPPAPGYEDAAALAAPAAAPILTTAGHSAIADLDTLFNTAGQAVAPPPAANPIQAANLIQDAPQGLPAAGYELDAGTFANPQAAERVAGGLSGEGLPEIQTVRQGAQTVYRVVVHGLQTPAQVAAARSEATALSGGF